ncbi:hypothetical protein CBR_g34251 [Chara braunii]|uniref:CCHC-type domain-containing protein n=1 Tax=Chara braunii TaxID=69332 RepID=A0A388JYJ4_CHABU|nr:hypothetical protein CBR_g34251 [Chara braunii]|eukprot:GBG62879.1 hypothetical protein CBR_g34251 [Chara braunii]
MSARLDKRMEEKNDAMKKTGDEVTVSEEMEKIRKENDRLGRLLLKEDVVNEGSKVATLHKEIMELKQQVIVKKVAEDDIFSMKQEIDQLRSSALAKGNFESKLDGLCTEVSRLKIQGMKDREEVEAWKGEALRPGKQEWQRRNRHSRWTATWIFAAIIREVDKWKQEYVKMKEMHRAASRETEVLKGKQVVAEGEVIKLKEQLSKVPAEESDTQRFMSGYGDHRDRGYDNRERRDRGRDGQDYREGGYERESRRCPIRCFNCDELGHYANQCTQPRRQRVSRPSSSTDSRGDRSQGKRSTSGELLESKVAEISKSVAAVCQYVEIEQQKKAMKERRKMEKKEAEERAEAEHAEAELKRKKKEEKLRRDAEKFEEVNKHLDIKVALRVGELREDVQEDVRFEIRETSNELCRTVARGKQKAIPLPGSDQESGASGSDTEEISERTRKLCISQKHKRGPGPVFEGSPPMKQPPRRTPRKVTKPAKLTERLTRAKAKRQENMPTPKKTPPSIRKKADVAGLGAVKRLRFKKKIMNDLKGLDALVLQNICRDEDITYNGKFESIFDIAVHRAQLAFGPESDEAASAEPDDVSTDVVEETTQSTEG